MPEELWTEVRDILQKAVIKATSKKKKCRKQNDCLRRTYRKLRKEQKLNAKEKRKDTPIECSIPKNNKKR